MDNGHVSRKERECMDCEVESLGPRNTPNKWLSYHRGTARRLKSVEILSAAAQLYEKSHLTRRIAISCGIKISPVGSLD